MKSHKEHTEDEYMILTAEEQEAFENEYQLNNERMVEEYRKVLDREATYKGDQFLSQVFNIDEEVEKYGKKIFLIAGVGAGKSSWVKNVLALKSGADGNTLFITSRRAKVDEDTEQSLFDSRLDIKDKRSYWRTLVTNSKLGYFLKDISMQKENKDNALIDKFLDRYKYIIIDEVHSLAADSTFADSSFCVLSFMEYAVEKGKIVVAMTGTPQPIYHYFLENNWHIRDFRKQCKYVKPMRIDKIIKDKVLKKIKSELEAERKVIYFVNNVAQIKALCKKLTTTKKISEEKAIIEPQYLSVIVAKTRNEELKDQLKDLGGIAKKIIDNSQKTYNNIVQKQLLPDTCKILISTSTLREGIDIFNENVTVICDNHILSNIIQFCGRTRLGDSVFYVVEDSSPHKIEPNELLYCYACKDEMNAANHFYVNEVDGKLFGHQTNEFIEHVERNVYVRFNYIKKIFMIDHMRYKEELRLKCCLDTWEEDLKEYCNEYNIPNFYMTSSQKKEWVLKGLDNLVAKEKMYLDHSQKEQLCQYLYAMLGFKKMHKQYTKINEELKRYGYKIISDTESQGDNRNKNYWQFVKIEKKKNERAL